MPGVIGTLKSLKKQGLKVAVISNHPFRQDAVRQLLQAYGLNQYVDELIVSSEIGWLKSPADPQGRIFTEVQRRLRLPGSAVVHVGDNPDADGQSPKSAGMRGIVYRNPFSLQQRLLRKFPDPNQPEYKRASLEAHKEALTLASRDYYERSRSQLTSEKLAPYALRLYEISRDIYGPILVKYAEQQLEHLRQNQDSMMNLCVGRDGLAMFLVQRRLLQLFPEKYQDISPHNIQFVNLSRKSVKKDEKLDQQVQRNQLATFLDKVGFRSKKRININDNGIEGTIQNRLQELFPEKSFEGNYLLCRKLRSDQNNSQKHGFLVECDTSRINPDVLIDHTCQGPVPELTRKFMSIDFVHLQEDLWNGIFASAKPLVDTPGLGFLPENWRQHMDFIPGNPDVIPEFRDLKNYELMKRLALKGILDSIKVHRRETQLGVEPLLEERIRRLGNWFHDANSRKATLDHKLLHGMVRKRD